MRRKKFIKQSFESTGTGKDTSANIYESMLVSPAWVDLTASQMALYLVCKAQFFGKKKPGENCKQFYMNQALWLDKYKLYSGANLAGFYRDMNGLIEHGFIVCAENGASTRTRNVYEYSDQWRVFGTDDFRTPPSQRTRSGRCRKEEEKDG